jgi:hypothetical protein
MKPSFRSSLLKARHILFPMMFLPGIVFAQLSAVTLTAASFNKDVIAEGGLSPLGVTSSAFDGANNHVFYSKAFQALNFLTIPGGGLPNGGTMVNGSDTWQLASYSGNNCLLFAPQSVASSASLFFTAPSKYLQLALLATAGNGPCSINVSLHFTDLSTSNYGAFSVHDWFGGATSVINGLGNVLRTLILGIPSGLGSGDPRLYQITLNLTAADQAKSVDRIDITDNSTNNSATVGFFAVSGQFPVLSLNMSLLEGQYNVAQNKVVLSWKTYGANSPDYFDIERSANGSLFSSIGTVVPPKSNLTQSFTYNDGTLGGGNNWYYRVKGQSSQGPSNYSNTILIQTPATGLTLLQQGGGTARISGDLSGASYSYSLTNYSGQRLQSGTLSPANGYSVNTGGLQEGLYLLTIHNAGRTQTFRFFKQ